MLQNPRSAPYKMIFTPVAQVDRTRAFEEYWRYLVVRDGAIEEEAQSLEHKTGYYRQLQARPVYAQQPLMPVQRVTEVADHMAGQDLQHVDRRLLALTAIYKFACHEAAGIRAAWNSTPSWARCRTLQDKITRYHLCEEFCHLRLFAEMFKVFSLHTEWSVPSWFQRTAYAAFTHAPAWLLSPIAFGSEVMGMMFYRHIWRVLQDLFAPEPTVLARLHELLGEIMVDELGHIGERRSYLGNAGINLARKTLPVMMRRFFAEIPEAEALLDVNCMVDEALRFDYSDIDTSVTARAWIPSYCQA
jgi:hypothetical protein